MVKVNFRWGGEGYLHLREQVKIKIRVQIKTFHSKRVVYEFQVQISDKVERLIDFLTLKDPEGMQNYNESRFIYPMGRLRQINLDQTFEQQDIPDGAKLILMGQKSFSWDINNIGANI
jgi:hypothetical protein